MKFLTRTTRRLSIRPLKSSDYTAWKLANTSRLPQKNEWDRKNKAADEITREKFSSILASQKKLRAEDKFFEMAVFEMASGRIVGNVAIMDVLRGLGHTAYLGYSIDNLYWGRGFGKESVRAAIDIAFRDIKLHRIEAGIEPGNRRSAFLARSLGLRREGLKKRSTFLRGEWRDLSVFAATCEEFGISFKGKLQVRLR